MESKTRTLKGRNWKVSFVLKREMKYNRQFTYGLFFQKYSAVTAPFASTNIASGTWWNHLIIGFRLGRQKAWLNISIKQNLNSKTKSKNHNQ